MFNGMRILLVHIGKTAGGTVSKALSVVGIKSRQLHLHALDSIMIEEYDVLIICLRDPVARVISAFNWRNPRYQNLTQHYNMKQCGVGSHSKLYSCCGTVDQYAHLLADTSECGAIAREGECHTELDTCAYLGGVVAELDRHKEKIFVVDTETISTDLNRISRKLGWGKTFSSLPRLHDYDKPADLTRISAAGLRKLKDFLEFTGEGPLYRRLLMQYRLHE